MHIANPIYQVLALLWTVPTAADPLFTFLTPPNSKDEAHAATPPNTAWLLGSTVTVAWTFAGSDSGPDPAVRCARCWTLPLLLIEVSSTRSRCSRSRIATLRRVWGMGRLFTVSLCARAFTTNSE